MMSSRESRGLFDRLVGACLSLMVAAIALSIAVSVIRPYFTVLAVVGGLVVAAAAWRGWQRSRW